MVGRDILQGMTLSQRIEPTDYSHLIVACLLHDIGYMRGVLSGDTETEFVVDGSGGVGLSKSSHLSLVPNCL
jgi:predicted HD phosphohydrolase